MRTFVKFDCGCIGFADPDRKGDCVVYCVRQCDLSREQDEHPLSDVGIFRRDSLAEKGYVVLDDAECEKLLNEIGELVADGHKLRSLRAAMQGAGLTPTLSIGDG